MCSTCGYDLRQAVPAAPPPSVPNYLAWAILSTICCCWPFGIPAIVYAAQANSQAAGREYARSLDSSKKAKMWCWIAFAVGIVANGGWLALMALGAYLDKTGH